MGGGKVGGVDGAWLGIPLLCLLLGLGINDKGADMCLMCPSESLDVVS